MKNIPNTLPSDCIKSHLTSMFLQKFIQLDDKIWSSENGENVIFDEIDNNWNWIWRLKRDYCSKPPPANIPFSLYSKLVTLSAMVLLVFFFIFTPDNDTLIFPKDTFLVWKHHLKHWKKNSITLVFRVNLILFLKEKILLPKIELQTFFFHKRLKLLRLARKAWRQQSLNRSVIPHFDRWTC